MSASPSTPYSEGFFATIGGGSARSAVACAPLILEILAPTSIVDIGCGEGVWLRAFADRGVGDVIGVDGTYVQRSKLVIPDERFHAHDLTEPLDLGRTFALALCLEVAEHLPASSAAALVSTLTSLAPAVVFSAAIPGQGGVHHVNEQWPWYWETLFRDRGFTPLDVLRPRIWQHPDVEPYYQQNLMLYVDGAAHRPLVERFPTASSMTLTLVQTYVLKNLDARPASRWSRLRRFLKRPTRTN